MADKTIGQLPASAGLDDNSLLVTEQGGEARSITGALVKQFAKDAVAEDVSRAEQAAKDASEAKTSVDTAKTAIDQTKADIDQTKAAIDGIKTDIDTAKDAIDQANLDVTKNKAAAETAAQSAGTSARSAQGNANLVAAALNEADGIVEEVTDLRDETLETVNSTVKVTAQTLTDEQKSQARENIGAVSADEVAQTDYEENDETSPAYLKNRPFFDKGPSGTVKWDEENEPVAVVEYGGSAELNVPPSHLYLMPRTTDHVPTYEELETLGGSVTYQTGANDFDDSGMIPVLATYKFGAGNGNLDPIIFAADVTGNATWVGTQVLVVHEANTPLENVVIEKPGVYFASELLGGSYFYPTRAIEMTLTGGTLDDGLERLPEKFLPEGVAMEGYVDDKIDQASPFLVTLTDGKANCTMAELWVRRNDRAEVYLLDASGRRLHMTEVREEEIPVRNNEGEIIRYRYEYYATFALALSSFPALTGITLYGSSLNATATIENYSTKTLIATDGGTMTGALTLNGDPTEAKHAATKQYVDERATWENLPDKPFGEVGGDTLTWDGNTEGLVSVSGAFYKVSDAIPTMDDFANGFGAVMNGSYAEGSADNVGNPVENIIVAGGIYIVSSPGAELDGLVFPETGVYFMHVPGNMEVTSFTINGYTGFTSVKALDEKFLPDSVKGGSGGVEVVNITIGELISGTNFYSITSDKTLDEVLSLIASGVVVVVYIPAEGIRLNVALYANVGTDEDAVMFSQLVCMPGSQPIVYSILLSRNDNIAFTTSLSTATS